VHERGKQHKTKEAAYHAVWATKDRQPLITDDIEPFVYKLMGEKAIELGGAVFAINGMVDHVHIVVSIPPRLAVADFLGQVKGITSFRLNRQRDPLLAKFAWQTEYGVFSFDSKRLPNVVAYVENQKQHHAQRNLIPILERWDEGKVEIVRLQESTTPYHVTDPQWWADMVALSKQ
jgi:REP element-mobilizing transposase RayT